MLSSCATLDIGTPAPGGQQQTQQITAQDALRTLDREIKLAAVDIDDLCTAGTLSADKCVLAKAATEAAAVAYEGMRKKYLAGQPPTVAALQGIITTMQDELGKLGAAGVLK
jgi:hypothetical protein